MDIALPNAVPPLQEILENFTFLDDWEDRYRYLIELGRMLPPMPEEMKTETHRVRGCASQVWLVSRSERNAGGEAVLHFLGDSDAHIVRGLVALTLTLYSGKTASEILALDPFQTFDELGLGAHLTPQRSNGLRSMVDRIQKDARMAQASIPSF